MNLKTINDKWDLVVIGGGITGAGIFRESVRMGLKTLLVEQNDFAWGTSSRSSKLVHGGLRYLKEGRLLLTLASVKERERLLKDAGGLVEPLGFLMPVYKDHGPGKLILSLGLTLYSIMSGKKQHTYYNKESFLKLAPDINRKNLVGGFKFYDAQVDDARLVQRLINEAKDSGGVALNYTKAQKLLRSDGENISGLIIKDTETLEEVTISTISVINATGTWAEELQPSPDPAFHLRPLRGSHLVFPSHILPIKDAISFTHPDDNRPIFATPWEGVILFGTTDIDHDKELSNEPSITKEEVSYLMTGFKACFPGINISEKDCIATLSGIRPVLSKGKLDPSQESREHVIWLNKGLITVTGGKLTTFRKLALDTLKATRPWLPPVKIPKRKSPIFSNNQYKNASDIKKNKLSSAELRRIEGRYGKNSELILKKANEKDLATIPGTNTLWAELPYAAENEQIRHLSDLLLRRVRIGLLTPEGGKEFLPQIREICKPVLKWDDERWDKEIQMYLDLWKTAYSTP